MNVSATYLPLLTPLSASTEPVETRFTSTLPTCLISDIDNFCSSFDTMEISYKKSLSQAQILHFLVLADFNKEIVAPDQMTWILT